METEQPKKNKKIIVGGIIGFLILAATLNNHSPTSTNANITQPADAKQTTNIPAGTEQAAPTVTAQETPQPAPTPVAAPAPAPAPKPKTCDSGYYINSDGNCVQSPTYAPSAPAGATAECRDGTYSFSQHRSGTCSHHGGVARWL